MSDVNGQLTAQYSGANTGTTYFVHHDHLGSTRLMTAMNQSVYDSPDFMPFGEQIAGGSGTTHKFTGYERDSESGLDYAFARHMGSSLGRFMSPDLLGGSVGGPQSLNRYAYVSNSPTSFTDPSGLDRSNPIPHPFRKPPDWFDGAADGLGGGFGGDCLLDGAPIDCGTVSGLLGGGGVVQCPNNECSGVNSSGQPVEFVCGAGGACGYLTPQQIGGGLYEANGQFITPAQYNQWVSQNFGPQIDAQRRALAQAIADNSGGTISYQQAYDSLNPDNGYLQGGNYNFGETTYGPGDLSCGADASRCNGIHFVTDSNGNTFFHLDTSNPWASPLGLLQHAFVDAFLGNVAYVVIPRPWP